MIIDKTNNITFNNDCYYTFTKGHRSTNNTLINSQMLGQNNNNQFYWTNNIDTVEGWFKNGINDVSPLNQAVQEGYIICICEFNLQSANDPHNNPPEIYFIEQK